MNNIYPSICIIIINRSSIHDPSLSTHLFFESPEAENQQRAMEAAEKHNAKVVIPKARWARQRQRRAALPKKNGGFPWDFVGFYGDLMGFNGI